MVPLITCSSQILLSYENTVFLELKNNLEEKTNKVIKFWINNFSDQHEKKEDYLNFKQIADEIIIYTLNVSQNMSDDFIFEKFYIRVLKN